MASPLQSIPSPTKIREELERMVLRDFLGPVGGPDEEIAEQSVRDRYLVGMLAPERQERSPEEFDELPQGGSGPVEDGTAESTSPANKTMFPRRWPPSQGGESFAEKNGYGSTFALPPRSRPSQGGERDRSAALSCHLSQQKHPSANRRSSPVKINFSPAHPSPRPEERELCEPQNARYTVINGRVIVENGAVVTVDMGPVIEAHNRFSRSIA